MNTVRSPLKKRSFREQVYDDLRGRVQAGEISTDDRLVDYDLAAQMGVSRMPVREALLQLVSEGVLDITTRGFMLRRFSAEEIEEIFEIRRLLEPAAAVRATPLMSPAVLRQLETAQAACAAASLKGDVQGVIVTNAGFRKIWQDLVPNAQLRQEIERFTDHVQAVRLATLRSAEYRDDSVKLLGVLLDAFRGRDAKAVQKAVVKQLDHALDAFLACMAKDQA